MSKSFRSPKGILVIIAIIFVLVFSFLFKDMITYFKIIKIERLPTFKKVEISSPSRNLLVEGESNQYDIYFDKDKMGGELELKEIELFGFKANKNLEKKTDNLYTLTLSNIEQVEHVFENESNLQIYSSNSIKDKNQCYIKINWGVPAKRSIIMSKAFYISSIYTEISKPSSEKVTNMNDVYFEVKYFGDVANIGCDCFPESSGDRHPILSINCQIY